MDINERKILGDKGMIEVLFAYIIWSNVLFYGLKIIE